MAEEETTMGHHRHQDGWVMTREADELEPDVIHFEVFTCTVCGVKFIHKKAGPLPKEE